MPSAYAPTDEEAELTASAVAAAHNTHYLPRAHAHEPSATADIAGILWGPAAAGGDNAEAAAHLLSLKIAARVAAQLCVQMSLGCGAAVLPLQTGRGSLGACTVGGLGAGMGVGETGDAGIHVHSGVHATVLVDELELFLGCEIQAELAPLLRQLQAGAGWV